MICLELPTRNLRRIGVGENGIMRIGGWKTRSVFQRYDIVDNRDLADAMQKLERTEKAQQRKKSRIGHVLVTFGDSVKPNAPGAVPVKVN